MGSVGVWNECGYGVVGVLEGCVNGTGVLMGGKGLGVWKWCMYGRGVWGQVCVREGRGVGMGGLCVWEGWAYQGNGGGCMRGGHVWEW